MTAHFRIEVQAADKGWGVMVLDDRNGKALSRASDPTCHAAAVRHAKRLAAGYKKTPLAVSVTVFDERSGDYLLEWRRGTKSDTSHKRRSVCRNAGDGFRGVWVGEANALQDAVAAHVSAPYVTAVRRSQRERPSVRPVRGNGSHWSEVSSDSFRGLRVDDANALRDAILMDVYAPYVDANVSRLGGAERPSVAVRISLDPKEEWKNGIFHNSRYGIFTADFPEQTLKEISSHNVKPLRKTKFKTVADAVKKLNDWVCKNSPIEPRPTRTNRPRAWRRR